MQQRMLMHFLLASMYDHSLPAGWPSTQVALAQKARGAEVYLSRYLQMEADVLMKASKKIRSTGAAPPSGADVE